MSEVVVTVTPEIDNALDAWGMALVGTSSKDALHARLMANQIIANTIRDAVLTERSGCAKEAEAEAENAKTCGSSEGARFAGYAAKHIRERP